MASRRANRKKLSRSLVLAVGLLVLVGTAACQKEESLDRRHLPMEYVPGSFIVEMNDEEKSIAESRDQLMQLANPLAERFGCQLSNPEDILWDAGQSGFMPEPLSYTFHLSFNNCPLSIEQTDSILEELLSHRTVRSADADAIAKIAVQENDPLKSRQYYLGSIRRDEACDLLSNDARQRQVVVAVIDTGVDRNHPDLVSRFFRDERGNVIGANFVGKGSRGAPDSNWNDVNGHGTHVAGLVSAAANNGIGIAGVAGCANVKIMPVKVLGNDGSGNSLEIDRGIQWAAANGADIINLSLGSSSLLRSRQANHSKALYETLDRQGVAVFAAAGNDGRVNGGAFNSGGQQGFLYTYPASYDKVIAVASTTSRNALSNFSNRGERIHIAAPGSDTISTYPGQTYRSLSGTSMATPVAVGAYALALAAIRHNGNETLNFDTILESFMSAVIPTQAFSSREVASGGVVDAQRLVSGLVRRFPAPTNQNPQQPAPQPAPQPDSPDPVVDEFFFVGLQPNQQLTGAMRIALQNWPANTARIQLYWITGREFFVRPFTTLGAANLSSDGTMVVTADRYALYGDRFLLAVALDPNGRQLDSRSVFLRGL